MAEGAIDCHNKAITPDYIKDVRTKLFYGHWWFDLCKLYFGKCS